MPLTRSSYFLTDRRRRLAGVFAATLLFIMLGGALLRRAVIDGEVLSGASILLHHGVAGLDRFPPLAVTNHEISDSVLDFVPWARFVADHFEKQGSIPLWKPTAACGAPMLGNPQTAMLFPPNVIATLLGLPVESHAILALLKMVVAAVGAFVLARRIGTSFVGAVVAGACFGFAGFSMVYLVFPLTNVSCLLPWLLLGVERALLRPDGRALAGIAVMAMCQHLGGHPETAFHCQVAVALYAVVRAIVRRRSVPDAPWFKTLLVTAAGLLLGAGLAAVQILPFLEYLQRSDVLARRAEATVGSWTAMTGQRLVSVALFNAALVVLVVAARRAVMQRPRPLLALCAVVSGVILLGLVRDVGSWADVRFFLASDWYGPPDEYQGAVGYSPANGAFLGAALPLAFVGLAFWRSRSVARWLALAVAVPALVAYEVPPVSTLVERLPGFALAENDRLLLFTLLGTSLLVSMGFDCLRDRTIGRGRIAIAVLVPLLVALVNHAGAVGKTPSSYPHGVTARLSRAGAMSGWADERPDGRLGVSWSGYVCPPTDCQGGVLLTLDKALPVQLVPVPPSRRAQFPQLVNVQGPCYAFRLELPVSELALGSSVRVLTFDEHNHASYVTNWLDQNAWFVHPALRRYMPDSRRPLKQTFYLIVSALLAVVIMGMRGPLLLISQGATLLVIGIGLYLFAAPSLPTLPRDLFYRHTEAIDYLAAQGPQGRFVCGAAVPLQSEVPTYHGLAELVSYDAIYPALTARVARAALGDASASVPVSDLRYEEGADMRLLGMLGVRQVLSDVVMDALGVPDYTFGRRFFAYANPAFLPRARVVPRSVHEPDDEVALVRLRDPAFPLADTVVLAEPVAVAGHPASQSSVNFELDEPDLIRLAVSSDGAGFLVLADTWFPGWRAFVDGEERPILRANVALRAVALDGGEQVVEFRYQPRSVRIGLGITLASLLVCVALWVWPNRRSA